MQFFIKYKVALHMFSDKPSKNTVIAMRSTHIFSVKNVEYVVNSTTHF